VIFITVGHQMPFDRLIRAVDEWAGRRGRRDLVAQVGRTSFRPAHFDAVAYLTPEQFRQRMMQASGIVAHAGTGTIIAALELGKPLLVLPRLSRLGETRNDHQLPTARHFAQAGHILAAFDEAELAARLDELESFRPRSTIDGQASPQLLQKLREFTFGG
jgi:UDP-N-acetylglucosamine transferase subunit ALG13